ncbi:hypothetical protein ABZP36_032469 [Zizania latifolia]
MGNGPEYGYTGRDALSRSVVVAPPDLHSLRRVAGSRLRLLSWLPPATTRGGGAARLLSSLPVPPVGLLPRCRDALGLFEAMPRWPAGREPAAYCGAARSGCSAKCSCVSPRAATSVAAEELVQEEAHQAGAGGPMLRERVLQCHALFTAPVGLTASFEMVSSVAFSFHSMLGLAFVLVRVYTVQTGDYFHHSWPHQRITVDTLASSFKDL